MTRTTLNLDDNVLRELKRLGRRRNMPIGELASQLLTRALAKEQEPPIDFAWVTGKLDARVDLEDREAVQAILDGR
jgi:hypothetical protein